MSSLRDHYEQILKQFPPEVSEKSLGWAFYADDQYTSGSPLVIPDETTVALTNNGATTLENELPPGSDGFFSAGRIRVDSANDAYIIRLGFTVFASITNGGISCALDISAAGDGSNVIGAQSERLIRGSGSNNARKLSFNFSVFSGATFKANGGLLRFRAEDGNISLYDMNIVVTKLYSKA